MARSRFRFASLSALTLALLAAWIVPRPAAAQRKKTRSDDGVNWLKLDRAEAEPSWIDGLARLRVYVTAVKLRGSTIPISGDKAWSLRIGNSKKRLPYVSSKFEAVDDEIAIVLVLEAAANFEPLFPRLREAARGFLDKLPKSTRVAVIGYGEDLQGARRLQSKKRAIRTLDNIDTEVSLGDNVLIKATRRAVSILRRVRPKAAHGRVRKMIIIVSDGLDEEFEKARFQKVSKSADRASIRIHTLAHSPERHRAPMRGLAEMSKTTHGTFRLVLHTAQSFKVNFDQLLQEIMSQYVLTFYLPVKEVSGKRFRVGAVKLVSNSSASTKIRCGTGRCKAGEYCAAGTCVTRKTPSGSSILMWILVIVGALVGIVILLVLLSSLLGRRDRRAAGNATLAALAAEPEDDAAGASQHIVARDAHGNPVQATHAGQAAAAAAPAVAAQSAHAAAQRAPAARTAASPTLFVVKGDAQGQRLPIHHGFTIGKAPDCHLVLANDGFASGHHAQILMDTAGGCTLVDKGSTNGTFVNGVRTATMRLQHGMLIRVGATELRFLAQ